MKDKILVLILIPLLFILIVLGTFLQVLGRTITALSYLFWLDFDMFKKDIFNMRDDIKEWYNI